jgi:hypothetical protein
MRHLPPLRGELTLSERDGDGQLRLGFAEIDEAVSAMSR